MYDWCEKEIYAQAHTLLAAEHGVEQIYMYIYSCSNEKRSGEAKILGCSKNFPPAENDDGCEECAQSINIHNPK